MKTDRIEYDVFAYNALVSSFQNAGKPSMVSTCKIQPKKRCFIITMRKQLALTTQSIPPPTTQGI